MIGTKTGSLTSSLFILYVLIYSLQKEEQHLIALFGKEYKDYTNFLTPFLPIRNYKENQV